MAEVHNTLSEDLSFRRIIRLAENVEGMALYMMHVSAADRRRRRSPRARARGFPIYGETLHQYLLYTSRGLQRPNGQIYHTYPSLKTRRDQAALWNGLAQARSARVATDEVCCTRSRSRSRASASTTRPAATSGVEPRVAVMYTETVEKRGYSLAKFVDVVSSNAARIIGLYPRKGAIAVGADADIVVLDTSQRRRYALRDLHETDYTPWEGKEVGAWPVLTVLRGKVVVADGQFHGDLADGQYLKRRIPDDIRARRNANGDGGT